MAIKAFNTCFFCTKFKRTPYHVTQLAHGFAVGIDLCEKCGGHYYEAVLQQCAEAQTAKQTTDVLDLTHIQTPEDLLLFLSGRREESPVVTCDCGWTSAEFDKVGRMGCSKCYDTFKDRIERLVFPYHGASEHVGKRPRNQWLATLMNDPVERAKILRLQYAKALEMEQYEKAAVIKQELDQFSGSSPLPPETSLGQ